MYLRQVIHTADVAPVKVCWDGVHVEAHVAGQGRRDWQMPHSRTTTSRILKISTELNTQRCTHSVAADFLRAEHNDNTAITSQQRTVFRAGEPRHLPDLALAGSDNGYEHHGDQDNLGDVEINAPHWQPSPVLVL